MNQILIIHNNLEFISQLKSTLATCYLPHIKLHFISEDSFNKNQPLKTYFAVLTEQGLYEILKNQFTETQKIVLITSGQEKRYSNLPNGEFQDSHNNTQISMYSSISEWTRLLLALTQTPSMINFDVKLRALSSQNECLKTMVLLELCEHPTHQCVIETFVNELQQIHPSLSKIDLTPFGRFANSKDVIRPFENPVDYLESNEQDLLKSSSGIRAILELKGFKVIYVNFCNFKTLNLILKDATDVVLFTGVRTHQNFKLEALNQWLAWQNPESNRYLYNDSGSQHTTDCPMNILSNLWQMMEDRA